MASTVDLVLFVVAPIVALWIMSYERILIKADEIKDNWTAYRCNPLYMPFAGLVQPEVGAAANFSYCLNAMSKEVLKLPMDALQNTFKVFLSTLNELVGKLNIFRDLRRKLSGVILTMMASIMGKMANLMSIFTYNLQKMLDLLRRMMGGGYIMTMMAYTLFMFVRGFFNLTISVVRGFVYAMLAISIILAMFQPWFLAIVVAIAASFGAAGGFSFKL